MRRPGGLARKTALIRMKNGFESSSLNVKAVRRVNKAGRCAPEQPGSRGPGPELQALSVRKKVWPLPQSLHSHKCLMTASRKEAVLRAASDHPSSLLETPRGLSRSGASLDCGHA